MIMQGEQKTKKRIILWAAVAALALLLGIGAYGLFGSQTSRGYRDYTIQKEQYYVEYSDQYDYWDVITVEYPVLQGVDGEQAEAVNQIFYDTAMDKVNYWHLFPDEEVKALQEEYSLYCSDVRCDVTFHSQYLVSVAFRETYAPISPVYYVHMTQRSANVNLLTGEAYELLDILQVNDDFMELWCRKASEDYEDVIYNDEDTRETFRQWFLGEDEELKEYYMFRPFFYVMEEGDFVVGLAVDPNVKTVVHNLALDTSFGARLTAQELAPYRTESEFWEWYEKSQTTGEVLPCENLEDNLWLGEDSSVWDYLGR